MHLTYNTPYKFYHAIETKINKFLLSIIYKLEPIRFYVYISFMRYYVIK